MESFKNRFVTTKTLYNALYSKYQDTWLDVMPLTLWMNIKSNFGVNASDEVKEKIMALQTFLKTDGFFTSPVGFEKIVTAFNGKINNMSIIVAASPFEIAWAIHEAKAVKSFADEDFDDDVIGYVIASCKTNGFVIYPPQFKAMQPQYPRKSLEASIVKAFAMKTSPFAGDKWDPLQRQKDLLEAVEIYINLRIEKGT